MAEDLTPEENQPEVEFEFTRREEYISSCYYALSSVEGVDTELMSEAGKQRIKKIRKRCLTIIDDLVKEMYDELYNNDVEE